MHCTLFLLQSYLQEAEALHMQMKERLSEVIGEQERTNLHVYSCTTGDEFAVYTHYLIPTLVCVMSIP